MMSSRKYGLGFLALTTTLLLTACLGTDVKKLGDSSGKGTGTGTTDSDSFAITIAYRKDADPDDGRLVILQGVKNVGSANLANLCSATGEACSCQFYTANSLTSPVTVLATSLSATHNTLQCTIPNSLDPDDYPRVRLRTASGTKTTGFLQITRTLTLEDIVGDLAKNQINGVFRYQCVRSFLEGEGITVGGASCPPSQRLGLLAAPYNFYVWKNQLDQSNYNSRAVTDAPYEGGICLRNNLTRISCSGSSPTLTYGVSNVPNATFTIAMNEVPHKPEGEGANGRIGYAALPDTSGNCPLGLVPIRQYVAKPQSIIQGSLDGTNPPSNFVNFDGRLDSYAFETAQPAPYVVQRQANQTPCEQSHTDPAPRPAPGSCENVTFQGTQTLPGVDFAASAPLLCAIPKELLSTLF